MSLWRTKALRHHAYLYSAHLFSDNVSHLLQAGHISLGGASAFNSWRVVSFAHLQNVCKVCPTCQALAAQQGEQDSFPSDGHLGQVVTSGGQLRNRLITHHKAQCEKLEVELKNNTDTASGARVIEKDLPDWEPELQGLQDGQRQRVKPRAAAAPAREGPGDSQEQQVRQWRRLTLWESDTLCD